MKFHPLPIAGAYRVELEPHHDARGYFVRTFCAETFAARGLATQFTQCSSSFNLKRGLIRGMHAQRPPHGETKLIRCTRGAVYDVLLDVRPGSPTYKQWCAVELSADNGQMVYAPKDVAHGFQVLEDASEVFYMMDAPYVPEAKLEFDPHGYGIEWRLPHDA